MLSARRLTQAVAAAGAAFTTWLMIYASEPWNTGIGQWALVLPFAVLALSPYIVLFRLARRGTGDAAKARVLLVVAILVTAPAVYAYILGFLVTPDPQSGLLFVFLPLYQLMAGAALGVVLWLSVVLARRWRS